MLLLLRRSLFFGVSGSFLNVPCFIVCFLNTSMLHVTCWKTIWVAKLLVSPSIKERRGTEVLLYPSINKIEERQGANIHYRTGRNEIVKCLPVKTIRRDLTLCTLYKGFSEIRYKQSLCKIMITLKGSKVKKINYTWSTPPFWLYCALSKLVPNRSALT